jgi:hypothetical protein
MSLLLTGEAKEVSQLANKNYEELRKALVDRFGRRPHQYFADLLEVKRGENETYRGLMAKIQQSVNRFVILNPAFWSTTILCYMAYAITIITLSTIYIIV